jgi:ribosome-associated heat shock protein Hsp15
MRLDKWLWCARFYKTRNQAINAVKTGKVSVNSERVKPARLIQTDDWICIRRSPYRHEIKVNGLAKTRLPASGAARLYEESRESIANRELLAARLNAGFPGTRGRPNRRDRRELIRFKSKLQNQNDA